MKVIEGKNLIDPIIATAAVRSDEGKCQLHNEYEDEDYDDDDYEDHDHMLMDAVTDLIGSSPAR